jgi:VanZ family protein
MSLTFFVSRPFRAAFFWVGFAVWLGVLWSLSSGPPVVTEQPSGLAIPIDKLLHFFYFFGGAVCLMLAMAHSFALKGWKLVVLVFVTVSMIGAVDEWHQTFTPDRQGGDPWDWSADCAGGIAGVLVIGCFYGLRERAARAGELAPAGD